MEFTFHSLDELRDFIEFAGFVRPFLISEPNTDEAVSEIAQQPEAAQASEIEAPESDRDLSRHPVAEVAAGAKPARKRRTKAEMEAARAGESEETTAAIPSETTPAGTQAVIAPENTANPFAQSPPQEEQRQSREAKLAETSEPAERGELTEFLAARLAERPEVSQIEHLNLARAFIGKHGMPKYNESFALVGLSSNVMTFGPTECAKHAAVLDFLASE